MSEQVFITDMSGVTREHVLRALAPKERRQMSLALELNEKYGKKYLEYSKVQTTFLAKCLADEDGKRVPIQEIRTWPAQVVDKMFDKLLSLSEND